MPSATEPPSFFDKVRAEEFARIRGRAEDQGLNDPPLAALCISGGGIRSATFGLGAIQALADQGVLGDFDYLSTVSGGGYIGAWLTSWKHRAGGLNNILPQLRPGSLPMRTALDPVGHLRDFNNYLSPKRGFLSADTWTLVATVIRNMTLNWLVLVPLLMFALMIPRFVLTAGLSQSFHCIATPPVSIAILKYVIVGTGGLLFASAVFNMMRYLPGVGRKDHTEKDFLLLCLLPMVCAALGFMIYDSWFDPSASDPCTSPGYPAILACVAGSCAAGWLAYLACCVKGFRQKVRLLRGRISLAILLTGISTGTAAWLLSTDMFRDPDLRWSLYTTIGPPLLLLAFITAQWVFVGLTSRALGDEDREWLARSSAWMLLVGVGWAAICGLVLIVPGEVFKLHSVWERYGVAFAGGISAWISSLAGFSSESGSGGEESQRQQKLMALVFNAAAKLAAPVFVSVVLIGLAILTNRLMAAFGSEPVPWTNHEYFLEYAQIGDIVLWALVFLAIGLSAGFLININKFSLHAMYRSRLIRAWLGASNNDLSKADHFIGFNETDNIRMSELKAEQKPFPVVNITLNLVAGKRLAWQQRKAESFTMSPLHCGSASLGYRPSGEYAGGISLGTAITISGAAASPNMGYHSSGVIGFIMTLFNARLGAWLGNPGRAGESTWREEGPRLAASSLLREAFGRTDDSSAYVYLSDGGHFENLGLYEMVRRRCGRILVLDSGCDPGFIYEDLGNALRKIRIDMGIPIEFEEAFLKPMRDRKKRCALARIRYSAVDSAKEDGVLIYVKPMMAGNEPPDVAAYQSSHQAFPHQGTANQWYDESQTESYRMLGLYTIEEMCAGRDRTGGLSGLFDHIRDAYLPEPPIRKAASAG